MGEDLVFGAMLRRFRVTASLSQASLGERAHVSTNAIAALERGRRGVPRPSTVLLLADALGLGPTERAALINAASAQRAGIALQIDSALPPLPTPLTSFVGREQELAYVQQMLASTRVLTLTGVGGIGKTRLALEAAQQVAGEVAFVELAAVTTGSAVAHAVASVVQVHEQPGRPITDTLAAALRPRRLLLALDNCEHLVASCAELADALLRACPDLRLLVTSREPLGIDGEALWQVPPLSLPAPHSEPIVAHIGGSEAVRLFVERARMRSRSFSLTEMNAHAIEDVCRKLDGMPLAIELAAAWVPSLTPDQIAARLADRFRLLDRAGSRTATARHKTLRAAIDWSYDLLDKTEQRLLAQLSVFAGGWLLEAAEAVCGPGGEETGARYPDVVEVLRGLVDKSLVLAEPGPNGMRYRMLETIREYAADRMATAAGGDATFERHRDWYLALGQQALASYWWGTDLLGWLERLECERANFRAALTFSLEHGDAEAGLRLAAGNWVLWGFRGPWQEGREWIERLLAVPAANTPSAARADALTVAGQLAFQQGDYASAHVHLAEAVGLQRRIKDTRGLAMAVCHAGLTARGLGRYTDARALHEEALKLSRAAGNRSYEGVNLSALAHVVYLECHYEQARVLAEQSLAILSSHEWGGRGNVDVNIALYVLGRVALCTKDYTSARAWLEEDIALWHATGDIRCAPGALVGLSCVALAEGDSEEARQLLRESLALCERGSWRMATVYALEGAAVLAAANEQPQQASRLAADARTLRAAWQYPLPPAEDAVLRRWLDPIYLSAKAGACAATSWSSKTSAAEAVARARAVVC
ncbi:MAG: helix-turn-helix domain-containing protein [Chloroflexi bacterium]|nr:helix-turn-helix domain-containing protein [Chloroflexota bacterium]